MDVAIGDRQLRGSGGLNGGAVGDLDVHAAVSGWRGRVFRGYLS